MQNRILTILLLISIYFTTIVYSAFDTRLQIEGDAVVRTDQSIRITNLELTNTVNGAYEEYNSKYGKDTTSMYLILPASSSITYTVEITNKVSDSYLIDSIEEISNTNNNVDIDLSLNINDIVESNSTKTFTITITNDTDSEQYETLVIQYGFKLNSFTVTFDANGGSVDTLSKTVSYGSNYGTLPTPTRAGYKFLGWNGKNKFDYKNILENNSETVSLTELDEIQTVSWVNGYKTSEQKFLNEYFKENTQYTISGKVASSKSKWFVLSFYYSDGSKEWINYNNSNIYLIPNEFIDIEYTTVSNKTLSHLKGEWSNYERMYIDINSFMIEEGDTVTEYEPYYLTSSTKVVQPNNHTLTAIWETEMENNVVEYSAPNSYEFIAPYSGTYKIELWGAQGGNGNNAIGGYGGYTSGNIFLNSSNRLYVYVGSHPTFEENSFNGGGDTNNVHYPTADGGGATDVRLVRGNWDNFNSLKSRIMVSGAGGGSIDYLIGNSGGSSGGLIGYEGLYVGRLIQPYSTPTGGTQNSGGIGDNSTYSGQNGSFGKGGNGDLNYGGGAGGSGYYGGGGGGNYQHVYSGAGGSSFISGYSGCDAIDKDSTSDNIIHTGQANHYSGKVFTGAIMIDGAGCDWSIGVATNCGANQPQPDGTITTGHSGNGFARITFIE